MSALSQQTATNVLGAITATASFTATTAPLKVKLFPTGTPPSESAAGTEIAAGGNYTTGGVATLTFNAAATATGTYSGTIGNQAYSITNMPTAASIAYIDIVDSTGTPRRIAWGALTTARSTTSGDTLSFPANSIVISI